MRRIFLFLLPGLFGLFIVGCNNLPLPAEATPTLAPTATVTLTATPAPTPTATSLPPLLVLLIPAGAEPSLASSLQASFANLASHAGLRWQVRPSLTAAETASDVDYVVALPPGEGLSELVAATPNTRFLAVGIPGLEPSPNLIAVGSEGENPDQQGFLAGFIAATITPDWRVGVISVEDTDAGRAARTGFLNGVRFFCGLCRPSAPPYYEYPLFIGLPAGSTDNEWRTVGDLLIDHLVTTIYVAPGAGGEDLLRYLAQAGVNIIGGISPPDDISTRWIVSIRPEIEQIYLEYWPPLFEGRTGISLPLPILLTDINPELLSLGKQHLAEELLADLRAGYINTGISTRVP